MSSFEDALIETSRWLSIPGVETIIPDKIDKSFLVLTSCPSIDIAELIPENIWGLS